MAHLPDAHRSNPTDLSRSALAQVLRQPPYLLPDDGVGRAVGILRAVGDMVPVLDSLGRLVGTLTIGDLRPLLDVANEGERVSGSIRPYVRAAEVVVTPDVALDEVRAQLRGSAETTAFVVDRNRRLLGAVQLADLVGPGPEPPRPASAGGMATPWGVYLTTGTLQAGAGNWALAGSGVIMGLLLAAAYLVVGLVLLQVQRSTGTGVYDLWLGAQPQKGVAQGLAWLGLQALTLPVFVVSMRLLPLTRYHAAEHQAVHAIERGESLTLDAVRRMPRVHPRCGTNLIAAASVFTVVAQAASAATGSLIDPLDGAALGALAAFVTWRRVGAVLQQFVTTSRAADKHLESGIAAATSLLHQHATSMPVRATLWRRAWCAGMPQTVVGVMVGLTAGSLVSRWVLDMLS